MGAIAIVYGGRGGARAEGDGDGDIVELQVAVLQCVFYVNVTVATPVLLGPTVDLGGNNNNNNFIKKKKKNTLKYNLYNSH